MQIVNTLAEDVWRAYVENHLQGNIFHTPEMFEVFARTKGYKPTLWAAINQVGQPLGLMMPVLLTMNSLLPYFTSRAVVYGSVLSHAGAEEQQALTRLLQAYQRAANKQVLFTELRNVSDLSYIQSILQGESFTYEDHLNYLIDINLPVDLVWNNINKSARKNIKKTLNHHPLEIEEVYQSAQVTICYELLQRTYSYACVPLADRSLFEAAFDILNPKGMVKFLLGRLDDTYVAASVVLLYKGVIYGWYRGFNRDFSSCLPNDQMVWYILKWGAENDYHLFDFGGAGKPNEAYGPRDFKAKFGGTLVNYGRNACIHHPYLFKLSRFGYQLTRKFL